jgi:hypothetical protein
MGRPGFQIDLIWPKFHLIIPLTTSQNIVVWNGKVLNPPDGRNETTLLKKTGEFYF